jgi:Protein of unknown function (DUF3040)
MSNEAGLTDRERAILARLAEKAAADDPVLASRLRGGGRLDRLRLPEVPAFVQHWACGVLCAVVGMAVVVVGISTSVVLGVVGLLFTILGVVLAITAWNRELKLRRDAAAGSSDHLD